MKRSLTIPKAPGCPRRKVFFIYKLKIYERIQRLVKLTVVKDQNFYKKSKRCSKLTMVSHYSVGDFYYNDLV